MFDILCPRLVAKIGVCCVTADAVLHAAQACPARFPVAGWGGGSPLTKHDGALSPLSLSPCGPMIRMYVCRKGKKSKACPSKKKSSDSQARAPVPTLVSRRPGQ